MHVAGSVTGVSLARRCSRTACGRSALNTLTYVYADQTAVLGPLATYADALVLRDAINALQADLALFPPATSTQLVGFQTELNTIADAGPAAFDATAIGRLLSISLATVGFFTQGACDGFLAP